MENQTKPEEEITITLSNLLNLTSSLTRIERERMKKELQKALRKNDHEIKRIKLERDILKAIVDDGKAIFNWSTTDCDGVHSQGSVEFKTLEEYEEWEEGIPDWVEGPFSHQLSKEPIERTSWGQGWDIN